MDEQIIGAYQLSKKKLGHGSFGDVFTGYHQITGEKVAIKVETQGSKKKILKHENNVYTDLSRAQLAYAPHIPKIHWFGTQEGKTYLVMEFLQSSIEKLHIKCERQFSLKTTLMLAIQMLDLLKKLHDMNYVHRDIKPDNFLLGNADPNRVFLIDFGLTKKFKNGNNVHIKFTEGKSLIGTARYASINSHRGVELSRRDDLESLFYMLVYFYKGVLPWQGIDAKTREEKYALIGDKKMATSITQLCTDLPGAFGECLTYIKQLGFKDKPNYTFLRTQLVDTFKKHRFVYDCQYDWVGK